MFLARNYLRAFFIAKYLPVASNISNNYKIFLGTIARNFKRTRLFNGTTLSGLQSGAISQALSADISSCIIF